MDLIIRNAFVVGRPEKCDIRILNDTIKQISMRIKGKAPIEIDALERIVFPGFIDPHVHMDKSLLLDKLTENRDFSDLPKKVSAMRELKRRFTPEDVQRRVTQAAKQAAYNGTTVTRSHVEADPIVGYKAVEGTLRAKERSKNFIDIQTIAFPQEGWIQNEEGTEYEGRPYIREGIIRGLDVVGGNVNRALWDSDPEQQVDELFEIAKEYDRDIDMHLDNSDNAVAFTLPYVVEKTMSESYQGRVTVSHIPSLSHVPDRIALKTIDLIKEAGVNVCILPSRIRLTRVRELMERGVNVICGTDNMQDAFAPVGDANVLQALLLLCQLTRMGFDDELEKVFKTATDNAAKALGIEQYGIEPNHRADVVILNARSVPEAIRKQVRADVVIKRGVMVVENGHFLLNREDYLERVSHG